MLCVVILSVVSVIVFCVVVLFNFTNCHYAEILMLSMPSFILLSVITPCAAILRVVMLSVIIRGFVILCFMLTLVAPFAHSKFS